MVFIMENIVFIRKIILIVSLLLFLFCIRVNFQTHNYNNLYYKYVPNYSEKYNDLLTQYELINENYNFIPAEIIDLSVMKIGNIFLINKGINDSVIENSYVVDSTGLVGVVKKAFKNYSVVQLKSSSNIKIAVEINDCYGTLTNKGSSYIDDLINCNDVNINDPVFTSKYSISSSNILVGYVSKIKDNKIYIRFSSNPYKNKFVGVVYDSY